MHDDDDGCRVIDRQFCLDMAAAHRKSTTAQNKAHAAAYEALAARLVPVPPVVVPPVVVPPVAPRFSVVGRDIIGPDGRKFVPVGANGGVWDSPNGFSSLGTMAGHVADAKAWGWNCVRLNAPVLGGSDTMVQLVAQTTARVAEYTAAGIVCIVEYHGAQDAAWSAPAHQATRDFWTALLPSVKTNPLVWINPCNEPWQGAAALNGYATWCADTYTWMRARTDQVLVLDFPSWGQGDNVGDVDAMKATAVGRKDVVFAWHHYGAAGTAWNATTATPAQFDTYADTLVAAGLPVIVGEFGSAYQGLNIAGRLHAVNRAAMLWCTDPATRTRYGFGALAWCAVGDGQNVLTLRQGPPVGDAYPAWYETRLAKSEMGARMAALAGVSPP